MSTDHTSAPHSAAEAAGEALFTFDGECYVPTDRSRGPWSPDSLHGSPVAALITHCVEQYRQQRDELSPLRIARQTVDLFRPVPYDRLEVRIEPIRVGRRVAVLQTQISVAGRLLTQATTLCLYASEELGSVGASHAQAVPDLAPETAQRSTIDRVGNRWVSYPGTLEMHHVTRPGEPEPPVVWIRADAPVLADRPASPAERAASIADFVSPFANMQPGRSGYVNADITLHLHRDPIGDWHYLRVISRGAADGVATAQAVLGDRHGAYGASSAASLINP